MALVFSDASFKDGVAGLAAVVDFHDGNNRIAVAQVIACRGSNQAEYLAAILGCKIARCWHNSDIIVLTDSELMAKQFSGEARIRSEAIRKLATALGVFAKEIHHQPRNIYVREADVLARHAMRRPHLRS